MNKRIISWIIVLALLVLTGTYLGMQSKVIDVKATSIQEFDTSLAISYEMGTNTSINYEMNEVNEQYDINVLYKVEVNVDSKYDIHLGEIVEDNDTYVNVSIIDAELNEYATFSTCEWDPECEKVSYKQEMDCEVELLGEKTYYVLLTCVSHEYKDAYSGTYDFSMSKGENLRISELTQNTISFAISSDQAIYKKISVDKSGWYAILTSFGKEEENTEDVVQIDLYDSQGNTVIINDGKCYLQEDIEYDAIFYLLGDDVNRNRTIDVEFYSINSDSISKEKECTYVGDISCEFISDETENVMIYSCSKAADPQITILSGDEEIAGNQDYSWAESENKKDFGVVLSVEKGKKYTLLMKDNNKSGEKITVKVVTYVESAEVTPQPTVKPIDSPQQTTKPSDDLLNISVNSRKNKNTNGDGKVNDNAQNITIPTIKYSKVKFMGKGTIKLIWKRVTGIGGYQVQYALSKKMKKAKLKNCRAASITIKKLKKRKTYYMRVRAYKYANGKKVYGKWSSVKKIKIKK